MANKIVSLLLQVKNAISPGVKDASKDLQELEQRSRELQKELSGFEAAQSAAKGLDAAKEAAKEAEAAFDETQAEVIRLKAALKSEKTPELALALEKAKVEASDAKKEWRAAASVVGKLETSLSRAGVSADDLAQAEEELARAVDVVGGQMVAHNQKLERHRKKYAEVSKEADKTTRSVSNFGTTVGAVLSAVGVTVVLDKIKDGFVSLTKSIFTTGDEFERLGKRLNATELGYITEFARETPLQLDGVAEAFAKLRVFGIDPMNGSLQSLVDMNAKLGGGQAELEGIITAVGQAWSKQKLQQEEVLQLIERGVPAWDLLAKATGKTVPELQKLSSAGALGRKEIGLLIEEIGKAADGEAAKAMDTLSGIVSNLQDDFTSFYKRVADAGALDSLKQALKDVRALIGEMAENGQLQLIAQSFSNFLANMVTNTVEAGKALGKNFGAIVGSAKMLANGIGVLFNGLRAGVLGASAVVATAVQKIADLAGFDDLAEKSQFAATAFEDAFNSAAADVRANIQGVVAATDDLPLTFQQMQQKSLEAAKAAGQVVDETAVAAEEVAAQTRSMQDRWSDYQATIEETPAEVDKVRDAIVGLADETVEQSRDVQGLASDLASWFQGVRSEIAGMSAEAKAAFDNRLGIDTGPLLNETESLTQAITDARTELGKIAIDNLQVFDVTGVNKFKNAVLQAKDETIIAYSEQKQKFNEYLAALQDGDGVTQGTINSAQTALQFMDLLGQQDLGQLRNALADAQAKLQSISDAASSTLDQLQDELDRLQGNQEAINQRDYEAKRAELQQALEEAERYGNQEAVRQYTEALKVLDEVRKERREQAADAAKASSASASTASASSSSTQNARQTTINLQSASGSKSVQLSGDDDAVSNLLAVLEDAGLRSS